VSSSDFVSGLGMLVVDHRLRRIVDQLLAAQADVYVQEALPFEPRWTSTFLLLEQEGALPVTAIAKRLRLSHPAIIKITNAMNEAGLVANAVDAADDRRRLLRLTPRARRLSSRLHRIWDAVTEAQRDIFTQAGCNMSDVIDRIEGQLTRKALARRVAHRLNKKYAS
jgi:DNA-binding MarR family transcriptional regulator